MCCEVFRLVEPVLGGILHLDEYTSPLPLRIHEQIHDGAIGISMLVLVMENTQCRIPGRRIPRGVIEHIRTNLYFEHFLPFVVALYDELHEVLGVKRQGRKRKHILVRR